MNKYEVARQEEIKKILSNEKDCGRFGRVSELENARKFSKKIKVSTQGKIDNYIKFIDETGKAQYRPAESKTSGGRLGELLNGSKAQYVIYEMHFIQKHKASKNKEAWEEVRDVNKKVMTKALFISKLKEFNAIKPINRNGQFEEYGIQVSSKKWYEWLSEYPVDFKPDWEYEDWMFEGLE